MGERGKLQARVARSYAPGCWPRCRQGWATIAHRTSYVNMGLGFLPQVLGDLGRGWRDSNYKWGFISREGGRVRRQESEGGKEFSRASCGLTGTSGSQEYQEGRNDIPLSYKEAKP